MSQSKAPIAEFCSGAESASVAKASGSPSGGPRYAADGFVQRESEVPHMSTASAWWPTAARTRVSDSLLRC